MPCSVYCLVSQAEEVPPAIEKLASAGVPNEAVTVVFRAGDSWLARNAEEVSATPMPIWSAPFASLSLWWTLASLGFGAPAAASARPRRRASVVVPSDVFEARRLRRQAS